MTDNDQETVYLAVNSGSKRYHTNPNCRYVGNRHNTRRREVLDAWGFEHCELCATNTVETYTPDDQNTNAVDK